MPGQQQCVSLHQPVDTLGVDRGQTVGSPLALEERGDPPVPVGRARIDEAADSGCQFKIAVTGLRSAFRTRALNPLGDVRARPSVSVTCFIGNRPTAQSWTARSVFLPAPARAP